MFSFYLRTSWRQLLKRPGHTAVHLFGLSLGLGCALLAFMYVVHEHSFDRFHDQADQVYRVVQDTESNGRVDPRNAFRGSVDWASLPEVADHTWLFTNSGTVHTFVTEEIESVESDYYYVGSDFFDVFTFPFVEGNADQALASPDAMVLTESAARRLFPDGNALGSLVTRKGFETRTVTGIVEDPPSNSHLSFEFLLTSGLAEDVLGQIPRYRYVRTVDGVLEHELAASVQQLDRDDVSYSVMPMKRIHLSSKRGDELTPPGNRAVLYSALAITLFVLLMASINFVNLLLAQSTARGKEVGVRKAVGADRRQLMVQFLMEALLTALLAAPLTHLLVYLSLPWLTALTGQTFLFFGSLYYWVFLLVFVCLAGVAAGAYPAFVLSSKSSTSALKGLTGPNKSRFRNGLVATQFCITSGLLLAAVVMNAQMEFVRTTDLGWDKEHLVMLPGTWVFDSESRFEVFRNELLSHPGVSSAARFSYQPGFSLNRTAIQVPAMGVAMDVNVIYATSGFQSALGLRMLDGAGFDDDAASRQGVLISSDLSSQLDWENPIGRTVTMANGAGAPDSFEIIGVVEQAQFSSLRVDDAPIVYMPPPTYRSALATYVRIEPNRVKDVIPFIEQTWEAAVPSRPFEFSFVDERVQRLYESEYRLFAIAKYSTWLGILIAAIGLFSLSTVIAAQRTKEIGIRKVFGAKVSQILILFSGYFTRLFLVGFVIALPVSYYLMNTWLSGFAFRIDVGVLHLVQVGVFSLALVLLSIGLQAWSAARANPVKALRAE